MQTTVDYTCIDNDNEIQVVIEEGKINLLWFKNKFGEIWTPISIDDLQAALQLANDEIKELDRIEMKLT